MSVFLIIKNILNNNEEEKKEEDNNYYLITKTFSGLKIYDINVFYNLINKLNLKKCLLTTKEIIYKKEYIFNKSIYKFENIFFCISSYNEINLLFKKNDNIEISENFKKNILKELFGEDKYYLNDAKKIYYNNEEKTEYNSYYVVSNNNKNNYNNFLGGGIETKIINIKEITDNILIDELSREINEEVYSGKKDINEIKNILNKLNNSGDLKKNIIENYNIIYYSVDYNNNTKNDINKLININSDFLLEHTKKEIDLYENNLTYETYLLEFIKLENINKYNFNKKSYIIIDNILNKQSGGYLTKYLKYKKKYLELQKKLNYL